MKKTTKVPELERLFLYLALPNKDRAIYRKYYWCVREKVSNDDMAVKQAILVCLSENHERAPEIDLQNLAQVLY
jgi:hypothetical protein